MMKDIKNICCIGAGFVGGPTMAVIAYKCPGIKVNVVDINEKRIDSWNSSDLSKLPVFEPGLREIISSQRGVNLYFTTEIAKQIANSDLIFISVNTPTKTSGIGAGMASDLKWIEASARQIKKYATGETIVVEKSTIPVKTAQTIKTILESKEKSDSRIFHVLSNPEFLAEGTAINDLMYPDRVLIGGENKKAIILLTKIYLNWVNQKKILKTNLWSSELSKLAANAFLAQRVSSINSISALCEVTGANILDVSKSIGTDKRIGKRFLSPGPGFGGSCFKKDILNLVYISNFYGLREVADYWNKVLDINEWQQKRISYSIVNKLFGTVSEKKIAILGFAFKANTNDTRESPAISISKNLINEGAMLHIYDPKVSRLQIEEELGIKSHETLDAKKGWFFSENINEAITGVDAIVIITEWDEFKDIKWDEISKKMRHPAWVFDTRLISNLSFQNKLNLNLWKIGNSCD